MTDIFQKIEEIKQEAGTVTEDDIYDLCLENNLNLKEIEQIVDAVEFDKINDLNTEQTNDLEQNIVNMISDIEDNVRRYKCYAYPKTMRSILNANSSSPIACNFEEAAYYGIRRYNEISLSELTNVLNEMVEKGFIDYSIVNGKLRYKSKSEQSTKLEKREFKIKETALKKLLNNGILTHEEFNKCLNILKEMNDANE